MNISKRIRGGVSSFSYQLILNEQTVINLLQYVAVLHQLQSSATIFMLTAPLTLLTAVLPPMVLLLKTYVFSFIFCYPFFPLNKLPYFISLPSCNLNYLKKICTQTPQELSWPEHFGNYPFLYREWIYQAMVIYVIIVIYLQYIYQYKYSKFHLYTFRVYGFWNTQSATKMLTWTN